MDCEAREVDLAGSACGQCQPVPKGGAGFFVPARQIKCFREHSCTTCVYSPPVEAKLDLGAEALGNTIFGGRDGAIAL